MPVHLGNASLRPATPSGAPESRCGGLFAATASSKSTYSDLKVWDIRAWAVRL